MLCVVYAYAEAGVIRDPRAMPDYTVVDVLLYVCPCVLQAA